MLCARSSRADPHFLGWQELGRHVKKGGARVDLVPAVSVKRSALRWKTKVVETRAEEKKVEPERFHSFCLPRSLVCALADWKAKNTSR